MRMIFLFEIREGATAWRVSRQPNDINVWFPVRNIVMPINQHTIDQIVEELR